MTDRAACPSANWSYPTSVRFGPGRLKELPEACAAAGIAHPLLVTDPGLAGLPMVRRALDVLAADGAKPVLFSDLKPNPVYRNVEAGVAAFRTGGHDGVVAMGGGSALDTGKAIAFQVGQTRPIWDFEDVGDWWRRADDAAIRPVVAIPTTAGTGSEVGRAAVILNEATQRKYIIFHPKMMPRVVIADAELTLGLPPHITAATGMDALAHNLEAYCSPSYHPLAEGIALEGMRLIKEWLPVAYREGGNLAARGHMLSAASMGATAFQKG
ncbi:MAG TPA: iron-containing alcohol dehydrogenase, partial [Alphaproteobacteria bacterium]|nr:iron-containing alcohol dehydrogenase [Alphaproteobacteria bacterium]